MKRTFKAPHLRVPTWVAAVYCCLSIVLIPWTFYLSRSLPARDISSHWELSWVGLDLGLVIFLLLTGLLAYLKSDWVVITATATGSLLLADAWFDVMSARPGPEFRQAILMAAFVELPLAVISYVLAHRIVTKNLRLTADIGPTSGPLDNDNVTIVSPSQ